MFFDVIDIFKGIYSKDSVNYSVKLEYVVLNGECLIKLFFLVCWIGKIDKVDKENRIFV